MPHAIDQAKAATASSRYLLQVARDDMPADDRRQLLRESLEQLRAAVEHLRKHGRFRAARTYGKRLDEVEARIRHNLQRRR